MPKEALFESRKPVTPYICSTPLDFEEERQFLSQVVFPKLNDLCRTRGTCFRPCDLNWKPGDSKAQAGLLLKTCLDAIKQCSPFFLGLLGETYGPFKDNDSRMIAGNYNVVELDIVQEFDWLHKNLVLAGSGGHPWVLKQENQFKSITELEVTQGALMSESPYITLYYRRSDHLETKGVLELEIRPGSGQDVSVFSPESEKEKEKIHNLKQGLVNKGVLVRYFSTLEELEKLVLADWMDIIDLCLPPLLFDIQLLDTISYKEWLDQQAFLSRCCTVFVATPDVEEILKQLTEFALTCTRQTQRCTDDDILTTPAGSSSCYSNWETLKSRQGQMSSSGTSSIVVINGDRGVGKSTLAAHWLNDFSADNPHICVISHFVSASHRSMDIAYFLKYVTKKLRQQFLLSEDYELDSLTALVESDLDIHEDSLFFMSEAFAAAISLGPCVILLDGVNELISGKKFDWLPEHLPATCRLIFMSTSSDISYDFLSERTDTMVINLPASLKHPNTTIAMMREHFPTLCSLVGGEQVMVRLAQLKLMQTALGSQIIGSQLLCYRTYSNMNAFMEEYAEVWSLRDFWTRCVQNWVKEHSWTLQNPLAELSFLDCGFCYSGWVTDCICLILLSRNGLTQDQILSVLKMIGYNGELEVTSYDWLQFRLSTGATLQEVGDGRLIFGHKSIQEFADYLMFKSVTSCSNDPVEILRTSSISRRQVYHAYLARYFSQQKLNNQILQELPWHLMFSGDIINLVKYLTDWSVLLKMMSVDGDLWMKDLKLYWSVCQLKGHCPDMIYLKLMCDVGVTDISDIQALEDKSSHSGVLSPAGRITTSTPVFSRSFHGDVKQPKEGDFQEWAHLCEETEEVAKVKLSDAIAKDLEVNVSVTLSDSALFEQQQSTHCYPAFCEQQQPTQPVKQQPTLPVKQQPALPVKQHTDVSLSVACLGWFLAQFLEKSGHREASCILLSKLVHHISQKCPQTAEMFILLSRCHHCVGKYLETSGDLDSADKEYKLALHAVMAAIHQDDEMIYEKPIQMLKGLLLNCHGNIRIQKGQYSEAAELLYEASDCIRDNTDCIVLKSEIYYNLGIVCLSQYNHNQAELFLRESIKLRSQWFGWRHPLVTDTLLALAKLLADPSNSSCQDLREAKCLYRQALHTNQKRFGACSLSMASILYELGTLLAEENSRLAKMEAKEYLNQSFDIRTIKLGSNHPLAVATQQKLAKVNVALQIGNFEFGFVKHSVSSTACTTTKSLGAVTGHKSNVLRKLQNDGSKSTCPSVCSQGHENLTMSHSRPVSITNTVYSLTSASERLLSVPLTQVPRLLQRSKQDHPSQAVKQHVPKETSRETDNHAYVTKGKIGINVAADTNIPDCEGCDKILNPMSTGENQYAKINTNAAVSIRGELNQTINDNTHSKQPVTAGTQQTAGRGHTAQDTSQEILTSGSLDIHTEFMATENKVGLCSYKEDIVTKQEGDVNSCKENTVTQHNGNLDICKEDVATQCNGALDSYTEVTATQHSGEDKKIVSIHPASAPQRLLQRYQKYSLVDRPQSCITKSMDSPRMKHRLWSGRSNNTSYSAAHSSHCHIPGRYDTTVVNAHITSGPHSDLLSLLGDPPCPRPTSNRLHHLSAWYHVPGRYVTPQNPYPRKRMQRTKTSIEIESYVALKHQNSRTRKQESEQRQENIPDLSDNDNHFYNGTYLLHSSNTALNKFSTHPRLVIKQDSTRHLVANGLKMPRNGHSHRNSATLSRTVKFQKNVVVG